MKLTMYHLQVDYKKIKNIIKFKIMNFIKKKKNKEGFNNSKSIFKTKDDENLEQQQKKYQKKLQNY